MIHRNLRFRSRGPDRFGTVTVEFAFTASIVFLLMFALIEIARFHIVRHSLDQAAYEGARAGIVIGASADDATAQAMSVLNATGIVNPTVQVTPSNITDETLAVTVRVEASYGDNSWITPRYFIGTNIVAQQTLDHENTASQ